VGIYNAKFEKRPLSCYVGIKEGFLETATTTTKSRIVARKESLLRQIKNMN